ncbi:MAG TPA: BON domain-containing protein [Actinomycetota bacterium]
MARIRTFAAGTAMGAVAQYFFDPNRGKARRHRLVDRIGAMTRRTGRRLEREGRYRAGQIRGVGQKLAHRTPEEVDVDDLTLKDRIESEAFSPNLPKGNVNVTVVDSMVELRGQLATPEDIDALVSQVREVAGVVDVRNLLHLPGTPAPNKAEAREAG